MPVTYSGDLSFRVELDGINEVVADTVRKLIERGFETHTAPDGTPWAPRKGSETNPLLDRSGALKSGFSVTVADGFIIVSNPVSYFDAVQYGSVKQPARPMVPVNELPEPWQRAIDAAVSEFLDKG